jgi:hypothetical protein
MLSVSRFVRRVVVSSEFLVIIIAFIYFLGVGGEGSSVVLASSSPDEIVKAVSVPSAAGLIGDGQRRVKDSHDHWPSRPVEGGNLDSMGHRHPLHQHTDSEVHAHEDIQDHPADTHGAGQRGSMSSGVWYGAMASTLLVSLGSLICLSLFPIMYGELLGSSWHRQDPRYLIFPRITIMILPNNE